MEEEEAALRRFVDAAASSSRSDPLGSEAARGGLAGGSLNPEAFIHTQIGGTRSTSMFSRNVETRLDMYHVLLSARRAQREW